MACLVELTQAPQRATARHGVSFCGHLSNRIHQFFWIMSQLQPYKKGIYTWNFVLIFFVDTVWIPVCVHARDGVWMTIISYEFLSLKLAKKSEYQCS